jgi:hypothetical protein
MKEASLCIEETRIARNRNSSTMTATSSPFDILEYATECAASCIRTRYEARRLPRFVCARAAAQQLHTTGRRKGNLYLDLDETAPTIGTHGCRVSPLRRQIHLTLWSR